MQENLIQMQNSDTVSISKKRIIKVLAIDDSEVTLVFLETCLKGIYNIITVNRAKKALEIIDESFDVILLDLMMPEMSGVEFIKILRQEKKLRHIPIIVLTAKYNTEDDIASLFEMGVNDYLTKPFFTAELIARIKTHAKIRILTRAILKKNRSLKSKNIKLRKVISREEQLNQKILDRTMELKNAKEKVETLNKDLEYSATHDALTSIYNRFAVLSFLENDMMRLKRVKSDLMLMMFDIDFFKKVNDTYGHLIGDVILRDLCALIKKHIREIDIFGRYGGEEFLLILPHTTDFDGQKFSERIRKTVEEHVFYTEKLALNITISIGLTSYRDGDTIDTIIERADSQLYLSKESGRNCIHFN